MTKLDALNFLLRAKNYIKDTWLGWLLFIVATLTISSALSQPKIDASKDIKIDAILNYCSDLNDQSCHPGIMHLDLVLRRRNQVIIDLYEYPDSTETEVKIDELEIKLNVKSKDYFKDEICLYEDTNMDYLHSQEDNKLGCALMKGKTLLFEGLNYIIKAEPTTNILNYYIVPNSLRELSSVEVFDQETQETQSQQLLRSLRLKAYNLASKQSIEVRTSFANRSTFNHLNQVSLSKAEFLENNPSFVDGGDNTIILSGDLEVTSDLIVPRGLILLIDEGTNIRIAKGKSFISYSPGNISGTANKPVRISSLIKGESFGVFSFIGSMGSKNVVNIEYLEINNGSQAEINGVFMSGMLNIYRFSTVNVTNSLFMGAQADDGLNIKSSNISLNNNKFINNSADAFDGDFVQGNIANNVLIENGNDGLDFSGSKVIVNENLVRSSGDKCISVGEATQATIKNNILDGCLIGIQVKDGSTAEAFENLITYNKRTAFDSYVKKYFFGSPKLEYYNNYLFGNNEEVQGNVNIDQLQDNQFVDDLESTIITNNWIEKLWYYQQ